MRNKTIFTGSGIYIGAGAGVALSAIASFAGVSTVPFFGPIIVAAVGVAGVIGGLLLVTSDKNTSGVATFDIFDDFPEELSRQLEKLQTVAVLYRDGESSLLPQINSVLTNAQELFKRINAKLDTQAGRMAAVNYTHTLTNLNRALGPDYYLDIQKHPNLWDNPVKRMADVEKAIAATEEQIISNIRQVNASQDIDFDVAIDALMSAVDRPNVKDMLKSKD